MKIDAEIVEILEELRERLRASDYDNSPWVQDTAAFGPTEDTSKPEDCRIVDCEGDMMFGEVYDIPVAESICRLIGRIEEYNSLFVEEPE